MEERTLSIPVEANCVKIAFNQTKGKKNIDSIYVLKLMELKGEQLLVQVTPGYRLWTGLARYGENGYLFVSRFYRREKISVVNDSSQTVTVLCNKLTHTIRSNAKITLEEFIDVVSPSGKRLNLKQIVCYPSDNPDKHLTVLNNEYVEDDLLFTCVDSQRRNKYLLR